jgi:hypothetical protein
MTSIGVAGAQLPTVDVPELGPVPTVQAPSVSVPKLPVPSVSETPALPAVPTVPTAPSIPKVSTPQVPTVTDSAGTDVAKDTVVALQRAVGASPGSTGTAGGGSAATGSGAAPGGSSSRSGSSGTRRSSRRDGAGPTGKRHFERRVRRTVRRFAGCLGQLPSRQRTVLTLRAGIGSQPPRNRRRVGLHLDLSAARVARIERRGLRALRALGRDGGCGAASGAAAAGAPGDAAGPDSRSAAAGTAGAGTGATAADARTATVSDGESGISHSGEAIALVPPGQEQASDWSLAVALAGLLLLGWALRREFGPAGPRTRRARR